MRISLKYIFHIVCDVVTPPWSYKKWKMLIILYFKIMNRKDLSIKITFRTCIHFEFKKKWQHIVNALFKEKWDRYPVERFAPHCDACQWVLGYRAFWHLVILCPLLSSKCPVCVCLVLLKIINYLIIVNYKHDLKKHNLDLAQQKKQLCNA